MRFQCPLCNGIVAADNSALGIKVQCGHCSGVIDVPATRVAPGAVIADFIIRRELGRGGMGIVYLAHQISLDRSSALKVLSENYATNAQFVGNFIKEARAAAKLNHPHIVQAYAVGEDEGVFYFAMEDVDGMTMKEVLKEQQIIPSDQALLIIQQIAEALDYAWHEQKLIHRDIKPDNIMLTSSGRAKLSDLGLASVAGEIDESNADEVMGTPQYISPEHLTGAPMDVRSDIYSLGATFYHFVTGTFPYQGKTAMEIAQQHLTGTLIPPNQVNPDVPDDVSAIIMKMMGRNPVDRYQSTEQLIDDIRTARHAVDGVTATIHLPKPGTAQKAKKTGGLRLSGGHGSGGKQLTLKKGGTATATNIKLSGVSEVTSKHKNKKKKKKSKMPLVIIGAAVFALLLAAAGIYCYTYFGKQTPAEETATVQPPAAPQISPLEKALNEFNAQAAVNATKESPEATTATIAQCEKFINENDPAQMTPAEKKAFDTMLVIYHQEEEKLLNEARLKAAAEYQQKLADAKRKADEEKAKQEAEAKAEREKRAAEEKAKQEAEERLRREKQAQEDAKNELAKQKKDTATQIFKICKEKDPLANADAILKLLDSCINNKYNDSTDSLIKLEATALTEWANDLLTAFTGARRIAELMKGDECLDGIVIQHPRNRKKKVDMKYNKTTGILIQFQKMADFMKQNPVYVPGITAKVAEKAEATQHLWAYKLIAGRTEKQMPEDTDYAPLKELQQLAGFADDSGGEAKKEAQE